MAGRLSKSGGRSVPERKGLRLRILENGCLEVVDPDPTTLELIQGLDPAFSIRKDPLPGFSRPRLLWSRRLGIGLAMTDLATLAEGTLWRRHEEDLLSGLPVQEGEASVLDLKIELARRMLQRCELCGLRCRVDRTRGERGRCGLGTQAFVYESYVHIAEEPPINPALNISLRGCGMRCRYCQQAAALNPRGTPVEELMPASWERLDLSGARSLTFVGGNPTESLYAILVFLRAAPPNFPLPIGWNCSGYDAVEAVHLLDRVCDVYIPDLKYGNEACARRLSGASGYVENARAVITEMCRQGVPVFVRILVLPDHVECCHVPSLEALMPVRSQIRVNILGQYAPDFMIRETDGPLARRPLSDEVACVRDAARALAFEQIDARDCAPPEDGFVPSGSGRHSG